MYGAAILVLKISYVLSMPSFGDMTYNAILFEVSIALLLLVLPTIFGTYIHQKLSGIKYFGGALSGFLLVVLSSAFVGAMCVEWNSYNRNFLGNYTPNDSPPDMIFLFVFSMGVSIGTPIGMIFGAIFHNYLVQSKSQLKQEIDA